MTFWRDLEAFGDRPALLAEDGSETSYRALAARADAVAAAARSLLPAYVDRPLVLIETANEVEPVAAYLAALRAGWPVILAAEGASASDPRIPETYRPSLLFRRTSGRWTFAADGSDQLDMHPDLTLMLSTSGTTGAPKLVRLSAANLEANACSIAEYLEIGPDERAMATLPFHYSYGLSVLHTHLFRGASLVLTDRSVVDEAFWEAFARNRATSMALVPFQFELLESSAFESRHLPTLRTITQAGGKLADASVQRYAALGRRSGWRLFVMYGQTEAAPRMAYLPPEELETNAGTIGRAVPGGCFEIIDAAGRPISDVGVAGELVYHGPNVMMGYATCRADLALPPGPPILHTGDVAERTANGFYRITGRLSRFVKMFGLRIGLDEIEQRLRAEGLTAYATGTDRRITVFVTGASDLATVRSRMIAAYGLTEAVLAVEPLEVVPLLPSGKIDYRALADRAARMATPNLSERGSLREVLAAALRGKDIDPGKSFVELGGDSLGYLEVQLALAERLGEAPAGWETMPVSALEALAPKAPARWQWIGLDLVCRDLALLTVIALHAMAWPIAGGAHVLVMLAGTSLARFQMANLLAGAIGSMLWTMLLPIVVCYYVILAGVHIAIAPVDAEWFALLGNFDADINPHGITPYWFVCLYCQALIVFALPFAVPAVRRWVGKRPLAAGLLAIAGLGGAALSVGLPQELGPIGLRHPLLALQLVAVGWCGYHARSVAEKALVTVVAVVVALTFRSAGPTVPVLVVGATATMLWIGSVPAPAGLARAIMYFGKQSMFVYLAHVVVIAVLAKLGMAPTAALLVAVVAISLVAAEMMSRGMRLTRLTLHGPRAGAQET
jgi:acyl-CoA synthetase (AMP-forming)/AMP-acid ligase II